MRGEAYKSLWGVAITHALTEGDIPAGSLRIRTSISRIPI